MTKICSKCKIEKDSNLFGLDRGRIRSTCRSCDNIHKRAWANRNREKVRIKDKAYYNRVSKTEAYRKRKREYVKNRRATDINYKLAHNLRVVLGRRIKRNSRGTKTLDLLGISMDEFKLYLESRFKPGMTWENYGEWELDHIKALTLFNLNNPNELKSATHYTNIQPLWSLDNKCKSNKLYV